MNKNSEQAKRRREFVRQRLSNVKNVPAERYKIANELFITERTVRRIENGQA